MQKQVGSLGACPLDIFELPRSCNRSEAIDHAIALNQEHLDHDFSANLCLVRVKFTSYFMAKSHTCIEIIEIRGAYKN